MNVGLKLKERRLELNMTIQEVANGVGVSKGTVSKWENGDIKNMRRDSIIALSKTLNVSPLFIMGLNETNEIEIPELDVNSIRVKQVARKAKDLSDDSLDTLDNMIDYLQSKDKKEE